jgi:heme exporter protein A
MLPKNSVHPLEFSIFYGTWMKSNSLELDGLVVAREGAPLMSPLNLSIAEGEMLAVRGSNGSGKSTLLKTLAGLIPAHSGSATIGGAPVAETSILYVGHKSGLARDMSVYDNVVLWARLHNAPELTAAALHYFDLRDIADVPLHTLSAGWQQRVVLTRLITIPAKLWLLDEPTANLDSAGTSLLQTLLHARLEQGGMVVIATHVDMKGDFVKTINISNLN